MKCGVIDRKSYQLVCRACSLGHATNGGNLAIKFVDIVSAVASYRETSCDIAAIADTLR